MFWFFFPHLVEITISFLRRSLDWGWDTLGGYGRHVYLKPCVRSVRFDGAVRRCVSNKIENILKQWTARSKLQGSIDWGWNMLGGCGRHVYLNPCVCSDWFDWAVHHCVLNGIKIFKQWTAQSELQGSIDWGWNMLGVCGRHVYLKPCVCSDWFDWAVHHCVLNKNKNKNKNIQTVNCSIKAARIHWLGVGYAKGIW
jgi:hypothetical protein